MRLTLRALLAYLYNVLDPAEADQFGEKVQESPVASGLTRRIRQITRKVRMSAPRVDAKGLVEDANNVADYLDNSLPEDRVADFERTCLESDMHLAEVASSYQILTMVLGKPADVPEGLRERIYNLPNESQGVGHTAENGKAAQKARLKRTIEKVTSGALEAGKGEVTTASTVSVPEVPDYLKEGKRSRLVPLIIVAIIALLVVVGGISLLGPLDRHNPALSWMFSPEIADSGNGKEEVEKGITPPTNDGDKPDGVAPKEKPEGTGDEKTIKPSKENTSTEKPVTVPPPISPQDSVKNPPEPTEAPEVEPTKETPEVPAEVPEPTKTTPEPTVPAPPKPMPGVAVEPRGTTDVGRYISDDQVFARLDPSDGLWHRIAARELLIEGEQLRVLPTFRPQIALASGVQVTFAGESSVQLDKAKQEGASRMSVEYGRFVVVTVGAPGARVELNLAGLEGVLTLGDAETALAIDVRWFLPAGSDPEKDEAVAVAEIFTTSGQATWQTGEEEPTVIPAGKILTYMASDEPQLSGPFKTPDWVGARSGTPIDRDTSPELEKLLDEDKALDVRLQEVFLGDRRAEVRALAARCLGYLDQFEPLVKELNAASQKSFWAPEVEALRQGLTRGPQNAAALREGLERWRGASSKTIYRLLWGYSPEQLASNSAKDLVSLLESPEMDLRVLASDNLRRITGAQLLYRPERRPDENKVPITKWKERLKEGSIAYKALPAPVSEHKPAEKPAAAGGDKGTK